MKSLKLEVDELKGLDPEILDNISPIREHRRMVDATSHIAMLVSQLREVEEKLHHVHDGANNDVDADAEHLLDGGGVATLAAESPDSKKATLNRQIDAFKRAVSIATERRGRLEQELVKDACADLSEVAQFVQLEMFEAFNDLQVSLEKTQAFYQLLTSRGLKEGSRPSGWNLTQFEIGLLQGGRGYPSIAHYASQRREVLGLSANKGNK